MKLALIDTGAAFPLAKQALIESIGIRSLGNKEIDQIEEENIMLEVYTCGFQMGSLPIGMSACFFKTSRFV